MRRLFFAAILLSSCSALPPEAQARRARMAYYPGRAPAGFTVLGSVEARQNEFPLMDVFGGTAMNQDRSFWVDILKDRAAVQYQDAVAIGEIQMDPVSRTAVATIFGPPEEHAKQ